MVLLRRTAAMLLKPAEDPEVLVTGTSVMAFASLIRSRLCLSGFTDYQSCQTEEC